MKIKVDFVLADHFSLLLVQRSCAAVARVY